MQVTTTLVITMIEGWAIDRHLQLFGFPLEQQNDRSDHGDGARADNMREDGPTVSQQDDHAQPAEQKQSDPDNFLGHFVTPFVFDFSN